MTHNEPLLPTRNPRHVTLNYMLRHALWVFPLVLALLLVACGGGDGEPAKTSIRTPGAGRLAEATLTALVTPTIPAIDLTLARQDVSVAPLPLRAGFPFTVTATIHNNQGSAAEAVPVMFHISARQEQIGYLPFLEVLTVTVPASQSLAVAIPVDRNLAGGEHQLWVQVNRLPDAWRSQAPTQPEEDIHDNIVLKDLMVDPFDAYTTDLCAGRVDVEIGPADVLPEPARQRVMVRIHNIGNRAAYNLPLVVMGDHLTGIAYTPAIPPCGGMAEVYVETDRPFEQGELLEVRVNPEEWADSLLEDDYDNNHVAVTAGQGLVVPPGSGLEEYDFSIDAADIETPELWIVLVTVRNLGARDAAEVPIRIENKGGRKITDAIPLVRGEGRGTAAFPVGYLWIPGGTLTFTINPQDADGAYPEKNLDDNVTTFKLP